ncbi:low molecular weight phosphatase family protein [Lacibacterium aquatile]|uniref:Low molecular weight phosphatase family protein n=1 Tax=Lacibacterium aquatile TaxID=1168082 RepID=A0ABW5E0J7_9PROT
MTGVRDRVAIPGSVLFMCTYNAVRSPVAEGLAKHWLGKSVYIQSAGVREGPLDGFAVAVAAEEGIDIKKHQPKLLEDLEDSNFDLIITLSPDAHRAALELTRTQDVTVEYWPTEDPTGIEGSREERLSHYRAMRDRLHDRIIERFPRQFFPKVG